MARGRPAGSGALGAGLGGLANFAAGEAHDLVEGRLAARGVAVEVEAGPGVVWGDRARLVELVQNLLDNAAKFMGMQKEPRVVVGVRPDPGEPGGRVFYVRDNGIGIEPEYHDRVFDLFRRLDPGGEGTGVGLALARRIVEAHGGPGLGRVRGGGVGFGLLLHPRAEALEGLTTTLSAQRRRP
jgi:signal transduction histidine kinase